MKKVLLLCVIAVSTVSLSLSQTLTQTYTFPEPVAVEKGEYTEFYLPGCKNFAPEGHPLLPVKTARILLPAGKEIVGVSVADVSYYPDLEKVKVIPASRPFPISEPAPDDYQVTPLRTVYDSENAYPEEIANTIANHYLGGHSIASFNIYPVTFFPAEKKIRAIKNITFEVSYTETSRSTSSTAMLNNNRKTIERIEKIADNPALLESYSYGQTRNAEQNDILIITGADWVDDLHDYADFKKERGYLVSFKTTEDIYTNYSGLDDQDKIRNCIIDYYQNQGTQYVILGGDADPYVIPDRIVPHRGFTAYDDRNIPADMYYACLDGTWNDDGDNKWGEPGEDDLLAELSVGRLCFDSPAELENMIDKLILYQDSPVIEDIEKALMLGENLDSQPTWGGDSKDEVADGSNTFGHDTEGVPEYFEVTRLYDRDINYNKHDIFDEFSDNGTHMLNHLGHSNTTYNMKMNTSDLTTGHFSNDGISRGFVIGYSQGCYNGSFDNRGTNPNSYGSDCFAEQITAIETAEVASIANSRYGWYSPGNTNGPSQFFDREFYDAIYGEDIYGIGFANGDSKEDNIGYITADQIGRWCAYELNVFGDPSMDIWTAVPEDIAVAAQPVIAFGNSNFRVFTDAPYARIGLVQNGELVGRGVADDEGFLDLQLFDPVNSTDTLTLSVIAHDRNRFTQDITVIQDQPYIALNIVSFDDQAGNNNAKLDYGETIAATVEMKNIGDQTASGVNVLLSTGNEFITITDDEESFGDFLPGETKEIAGAFSFTIDSLASKHTALFSLDAVQADETDTSSFIGIIHAPELKFEGFVINDQGGNNNGKIDPGETANLEITICNEGSSEAFDIHGLLETGCTYITINQSDLLFGNLGAGDDATNAFSVTASDDCPDGTVAKFNLLIEAAGGLSETDSLQTFIGQPPVVVLDLDQNRNSGPAIYDAVMENGVGAEYYTSWTNDIDDYQAVFVCLGIFWNNHTLTQEEGNDLTAYLNSGGNLYLEGGSTWWYDYQTSVHDMFGVEGAFGTLELNNINGIDGTLSENMGFEYSGDSLYWDKLMPVEPAFVILENDDPQQGVGVAHDAGTYKTIGTSIEFGGLSDGSSPSTKKDLMMQYLDFFEVLNSTVGLPGEQPYLSNTTGLSVIPNPVKDVATISWVMGSAGNVDIRIFNVNGSLVETLWHGELPEGQHEINASLGGKVSPGIYTLHLTTENSSATKKLVIFQ